MKFEVGDIVQTNLYEASILYKIVCFFDPVNEHEHAYDKHRYVESHPKVDFDDVHLEVVWKKHKAIAPAWRVGERVTFSYRHLNEPTNEMLVLALASS